MIALTNRSSTTTQKLVITLGGAAATTYPTCTVFSYIVPPQSKADYSEYRSAPEFTLLTVATETTIGSAPPEASVKMITGVSIPNPDTASVTMTIDIDDNGTNRRQWRGTLLTLESVYYGNGEWYAVDANGNRKEVTGSLFSSITNTGLTSGRVVFSGANGLQTDDADLTFSVNTLTAHTLTVSTGALTAVNINASGVLTVSGAGDSSFVGDVGIGAAPTSGASVGVNKILDIGGATVPGVVLHPSGGTQEIVIGSGGDGLLIAVSGAATASGNNTIRFFTEETNSQLSPTERMSISSTGAVVIASTVAASNLTAWAAFTTTRTGWTDVGGAPTVTSRFCQVRNVCFFQIQVVPIVTTATVAGTSYVSLPLTAAGLSGDASMVDKTTFVSVGNCVIDVANSRAYVPALAATGDTILIAGWFEV